MMYEALEAVSADFTQIRTLLADPAGGPRLDAIDRAIARTAEALGNRPAATETEKAELATLYRAMLAAQRIVASLREHHAKKGAA
jgi:hypothetical protein